MSPWVSRTPEQQKEAFFRFVQKIPFHECWEWCGAHNPKGYAIFRHNDGRGQMAHRYSYSIHIGEIPGGLVIDHICRNRGCVNPKHLRVVTPTINTLENSLSNSAINKAKTKCSHGHLLTEGNVYYGKKRYQRICRICAKERAKASYLNDRAKNPTTAQAEAFL